MRERFIVFFIKPSNQYHFQSQTLTIEFGPRKLKLIGAGVYCSLNSSI